MNIKKTVMISAVILAFVLIACGENAELTGNDISDTVIWNGSSYITASDGEAIPWDKE